MICFPEFLNADNEQINEEQGNYSKCRIRREITGNRADRDRTSTLSVTNFFVGNG